MRIKQVAELWQRVGRTPCRGSVRRLSTREQYDYDLIIIGK